MKRQLLIIPLVAGLGAAVAWRVHAQDAYKQAPSGGSTTVEGTETSASSKTGGRLLEVDVREGDAVKAGDVIAKLDCSDAEAVVVTARAHVDAANAQLGLAEAGAKGAHDAAVAAGTQVAALQAQVRAASVAKDQATHDKARIDALAQQNAIPGQQADDIAFAEQGAIEHLGAAQASVQAARAQSGAAYSQAKAQAGNIEVAKAGVEVAEAEEKRAELAIDECEIRAPIAGTITARLREAGEVIGPGMPVATLLDTGTITATFFLPDAELGRVQPGMKAELKVDAYPGQVFEGVVRRIATEAEFTPRNVQTREDRDRLVYAVDVDVANPDGTLRAGMPGDVTIPGTGGK